MNNSTSTVPDFIIPVQYFQYIGFGSTAVITNLIILFILFCNIKYLTKSAFITGLAFGDLVDGIALILNGAVRIVQILNGTSTLTVHPTYCMKIVVAPIFIMGNQIPGAMFFLVGFERFLAVWHYDWYYAKWTNKLAWQLTVCVYMFVLFSLAVSIGVAFSYGNDYRIPIACYTQSVTGPVYSSYNYSVAIVGGFVAAAATIVAMIIFTKRKARVTCSSNVSSIMKSHVKKQWYITRMSLCLVTVDFGFLVVPSILVTLASGLPDSVLNSATLKTWPLQMVSFRSVLNIIIYLVINSEFRNAARCAFCFMKKGTMFTMTTVINPPTKIAPPLNSEYEHIL